MRHTRSGRLHRRPRTVHLVRHSVPPLVFHGRPRAIGDLFGLGTYIAQRSSSLLGPALARAKLTGSDWVREEFTADQLHHGTYAPYAWPRYDRVVKAEIRSGFHILGLLDYDNTWDGHQHAYMPHWMMPRLIHDFTAYVTAIVSHYRHQIGAWQIWNEPDLDIFWRPQPNAQDYARLLTAAYAAVKRVNPHALVVLGGPSGADPNGLGFIRQVVRAGGRFDVLSMQPYVDVPDQRLISQVDTARRYGKPIWFTEMGWAGEGWCASVCGPVDSQADRLARLYVVAAFAGVQRVFWYDLRDDGTDANFEDHFGLLERNLEAKPAFIAYQVAARYLNRAELQGVDVLQPQVYAFEIRKRGETYTVLWNNRLGSYGLRIPWRQGAPADVLDWSGQQVGSSHGGAIDISVPGRSILYIVPDRLRSRVYWVSAAY